MANREASRLTVSVLLAIFASGCSVALMGVSAWLLSRAAEHPPVLYLLAASVGVRFFGIGRGVGRYLERLTGHDLALCGMQSGLRELAYYLAQSHDAAGAALRRPAGADHRRRRGHRRSGGACRAAVLLGGRRLLGTSAILAI